MHRRIRRLPPSPCSPPSPLCCRRPACTQAAMQPFFSVTLFTGQQLILEAIQRWLQRPCADEAAVRQRRLGLKVCVAAAPRPR